MEVFWIGYLVACTVIEFVCIRLLMAGYLAAMVAPTAPAETKPRPSSKRKTKSRSASPLESVHIVQTPTADV